MNRNFLFVIPGQCVALNPEPRANRQCVGSWVPDRASRVRNEELFWLQA